MLHRYEVPAHGFYSMSGKDDLLNVFRFNL